jgi:phosphoglycolate phosphatase-like HAD superfamily hydrolase
MNQLVRENILSREIIFWDFDGVIKDSIKSKGDAFQELFLEEGLEFQTKVRMHHEMNGGISRYEKIPIYLSWLNKNSPLLNKKYIEKFSELVCAKVINSDWVPCFLDFFYGVKNSTINTLVSATPKDELKFILKTLNLESSFWGVYGSPTTKKEAILKTLSIHSIKEYEAIFIGDSSQDLFAAKESNIDFILRRNPFNQHIKISKPILEFQDYCYE